MKVRRLTVERVIVEDATQEEIKSKLIDNGFAFEGYNGADEEIYERCSDAVESEE